MNSDIIEAITQIAKDKKIDKENLRDILENIFMQMVIKKYGEVDNFDVIVNFDRGDIEIYQEREVVEEVEDPVTQINLEKAQKLDPDAELGEEVVEVIDPESFGRRLIISAKQSLNQKIRDFERESLLEEYKGRIGEIIIGDVHQVNKRGIFINVDKTEVFLPKPEQIYNERIRRGDTIRTIIKEIRQESKGTEIVVSRSDPQFLVRLFELEVPEIYDGIIEIKKVAREAGDRSKIAVESIDKRVDAVGACVGMKGVRIQAIVRELNNEKIDIINHSSEPMVFIARAMTPVKPIKVIVNADEKLAVVILEDDHMALAIGKNGQNLRLASMISGYQIEPVKESEFQAQLEGRPVSFDDLKGLSDSVREKLIVSDVTNVAEVLDLGEEGLVSLPGFGPKSAQKLLQLIEDTTVVEQEDENEDDGESSD